MSKLNDIAMLNLMSQIEDLLGYDVPEEMEEITFKSHQPLRLDVYIAGEKVAYLELKEHE